MSSWLGLLVVTGLCLWLLWARCTHTEVVRRSKRDASGKLVYPHVLQYECFTCGKQLGETSLVPRFRLIAGLRKQGRARRVA